MTHVVHPYAHRLGILRDWKSRWFGLKRKYTEDLKGDLVIRRFLEERLRSFYLSDIIIERSRKILRIIVESSRPGLIIGRSGEGAVKLKAEIERELKKRRIKSLQDIKVEVREIRSPESNAAIVSQMVAESLERRLPFRRILKQTVEKVMANRDVAGVKILLSGRLGGAVMSRKDFRKKGRIPLQTFRADVDFARREARLPYGNIGIKVWIYKGEVFADKSQQR